jgi:hypothetical protein
LSNFPDLTNPTVKGPARVIALAGAAKETLRNASRLEPNRHGDAVAKLAEARGYLAELDGEIAAWEAS